MPSRLRLLVISTLLASLALGAIAGAASARSSFRPRIRGAMGIVPRAGQQEIALGSNVPTVYHGGQVMRDVTIHTLFWAPSGYGFSGPPALLRLGYEQLIQQFFSDVATDSGTAANVFSVLSQFGDSSGGGGYHVRYDPTVDSINATDPFPAPGHQCASPAGTATCVTDLQLQQELDSVIQAHDPGARGLTNVWFVYLPPNVDTCITAGSCGTNSFAGYHGTSNLGHGVTIYANLPDPIIGGVVGQGADPEGNPDAELSIDISAHEAVEAITDPTGVGWMDPNGLEVGDKCQTGPQRGTPLGYALLNGAPYNQVINGHQYLLQGMWSNAITGCVQASSATSSALPLAQVNLSQFSRSVSGAVGTATRGVQVTVLLRRAGQVVAHADATSRANGSWGPVTLRSEVGRAAHAVGDDRDEIDVVYGAGGPAPDLILTGSGGNAYTQSGYTGWFALDNGYAVLSARRGLIGLGPCSQTGVLGLRVGGRATTPPVDVCETESDIAVTRTGPLSAGTALTMSSSDNRGVSPANPDGALVKLTIPLGEPNSVSALGNNRVPFNPTGFPICTAYLRVQTVGCTGLVPGARYSVTRRRAGTVRRATADGNGSVTVSGFPGGVSGGDVFTLVNHRHRRLTTLHVAHLRVDLIGRQTAVASGRCEAGDYYGQPLLAPPVSPAVGQGGAGGTGTICPLSGRARGLSTRTIAQTDDRSGGQTEVRVPDIEGTSPLQGETVYGPFVAFASAGLPGPHNSVIASPEAVSLTITPASGGSPVFSASNVNTATGAGVGALPSGVYGARWVLTDANGDTRTMTTRFIAESAHFSADGAGRVF